MASVSKEISVNIKEQNVLNKNSKIQQCYKVTFTTTIKKTIFGRTWFKEEVEEVPFVFKSLEIAKDFCEIHPTIIADAFINDGYVHCVKYRTYRLVKDGKILGFIRWDKDNVNVSNDVEINGKYWDIYEKDENDPIVDRFCIDIILKSWERMHNEDDIIFVKKREKLSEMYEFINMGPNKITTKEWNFKLVEDESK